MRDVLETAPFISVFTERTLGVFVTAARGTEELAIQFDGIPGPDFLGDRAAFPIDTAFIDRTEIVFGAQGLLGGFGGLGGTVNMVRKMPTLERQASAEATVDERGSYRLVGDVSGPLNRSGSIRGRWIVGGQIRYQSEVYDEGLDADPPYRVEQPAYTLVDLMARYRITDDLAVLLNVDNLFDETCYDGISWPRHGNTFGAPRSGSLTLSAAF
jgi:outer membrane receptor for ferric coprogen and ferric-rhodotorulic acid